MGLLKDRNPFVGPRPIQRGEPLHGRSKEIRELYNRVQARRIVVLHSPSGAGKSSLVQAGLIPRLESNGFDVWTPIRVNLDPARLGGVPQSINRYVLSAMVSLEAELPEEHRRSPAELARLEFLEYIDGRPRRKGRKGRPVVLLFDQFEEVLTVDLRALEAKREFFSSVGTALDEEYWALFIIREDYLAAFAPYRDRLPTQMANTFRLDLLGKDGAREAATKLAESGGRSFPGVDKLVDDLSEVQVQQADGSFEPEQGVYVEPVQLQVVCQRLWNAMPEDDLSIDPGDIERYAGVSEALGGYYADAVRTAANDVAVERSIREWVGQKLIVGGIRSQVRQEEGHSAGLRNELIDRLMSRHLVRTDQRAGANWYELSHDRLVEPVTRDNESWEREHLHPLQVQAKLWQAQGRDRGQLLGPRALVQAQLWALDNDGMLTDEEREFLRRSERKRALTVRYGIVAVSLLLLSICTAIFSVTQYLEAEEQTRKAERSEEEAWQARDEAKEAERLATSEAERAHIASVMAGARELLARGQRAPTAMLLAELAAPEAVHGWAQVALDALMGTIPVATFHHDAPPVMAWSPDGTRIVVAADETVWLRRADGTGVPTVLQVDEGMIEFVAWSPDGARIMTVSDGMEMSTRIWSAEGPHDSVLLEGLRGRAWSPDGLRILTTSTEREVQIWSAEGTGEVLLDGSMHADDEVQWKGDGAHLLTVSRAAGVRLWSTDGARKPRVVYEPKLGPFGAVSSPSGSRIAISVGKELRVWSATDTRPGVELGAQEDPIVDLAWSPDGQRIASLSNAGAVRVWKAESRGESTLLTSTGEGGRALEWSPDGTRILVSSEDWTARLVHVDGLGTPAAFESHKGAILRAGWSPDGTRVFTVSSDDTVNIWTAGAAREPTLLSGHDWTVDSAVWSPDGKRILTNSSDGTAKIWNLGEAADPVTLRWNDKSVLHAEWSPDGTRIAAVSDDGKVRITTIDEPHQSTALGAERFYGPVLWSPDGTRILTHEEGELNVWNADGTGEPTSLESQSGMLRSAEWSPDGTRILITSSARTAQILRVDGNGDPVVLKGHEQSIRSAAWSPDGTRIVTASDDQTARIFSASGEELLVLRGHDRAVVFAAWSPDGTRIVSTSVDRTARVWRADEEGDPVVLLGHEGEVEYAEWSGDGRRVVTTSVDQSARVWAADGTGEPLLLGGYEEPVLHASWSPNGRHIVVSSGNTAQIWTVTVPDLRAALLESTTHCLIPRERRRYLSEDEMEARAGYDRCERNHGRAQRASAR